MGITTIPAPLLNKIAVVTAASRGIGEAIAIEFAQRGCSHIAVTYKTDTAAAESVLKKLRDLKPEIKVTAFAADVRDRIFGKHVIEQSLKRLEVDHIDILVNNAGLVDLQEVFVRTPDIDYAHFQNCMSAHAWACLSISLEVLPYMRPGGRIIFSSSASSKLAVGDPMVCIAASKAAQDAIAKNLAVAWGKEKGITVNSIAIGATETQSLMKLIELYGEEFKKYTEEGSPLKRLGTVKEVASIVAFVASPEASWINGNYVPANGGNLLVLQG